MKDWIGAGIAAGMMFVAFGPLLLARQTLKRRHREQFIATGGVEFDLPSRRSLESEEPVARPEQQEEKPLPMDEASARAQETHEHALVSTETGEIVRLGPDGLPLSEADVAARTTPTTFTVDQERLAEVLQMEKTGEYVMNAPTWAAADAAAQWKRDPLGSALLSPQHLIEEAGNPALADAFWTLVQQGGLTTDWRDEDSDFDAWYYATV
jgi:hypothetical protein